MTVTLASSWNHFVVGKRLPADLTGASASGAGSWADFGGPSGVQCRQHCLFRFSSSVIAHFFTLGYELGQLINSYLVNTLLRNYLVLDPFPLLV